MFHSQSKQRKPSHVASQLSAHKFQLAAASVFSIDHPLANGTLVGANVSNKIKMKTSNAMTTSRTFDDISSATDEHGMDRIEKIEKRTSKRFTVLIR